jgi:hypothetical protein
VELVKEERTMKSVVIQKPNELVIEERPLPVPQPVKSASKSNLPGSVVQTAISIAATTPLPNIRV